MQERLKQALYQQWLRLQKQQAHLQSQIKPADIQAALEDLRRVASLLRTLRDWAQLKPLQKAHRASTAALLKGLEVTGWKFERLRRGDVGLGLLRYRWDEKKSERRLVLIPGLGDTPLSWALVWPQLQSFLRPHYDEVVALDFPGFTGFLAHERPFHDIHRLREAVADALVALRPTAVVGHSLGGWLAASIVSESGTPSLPTLWPELQRLVLIAPSGRTFSEEEALEWRDRFIELADRPLEKVREFRKQLLKDWPPGTSVLDPLLVEVFSRPEMRSFFESFTPADLLRQPLPARVHSTLLWGEKDAVTPPEWAGLWHQANSNLHVVALPGVGHMPQWEAPRALTRELRAALTPPALIP